MTYPSTAPIENVSALGNAALFLGHHHKRLKCFQWDRIWMVEAPAMKHRVHEAAFLAVPARIPARSWTHLRLQGVGRHCARQIRSCLRVCTAGARGIHACTPEGVEIILNCVVLLELSLCAVEIVQRPA